MAELKPIASLSGILLARKGAARPAMRRPIAGNMGSAALAQDDLGWNDMGYDVDPDPNAPMDYEHDHQGYNPLAGAVPEVKPEVRQQQERIAEQFPAEPGYAPVVGFDSLEVEQEPVGAALTIVTMTPEIPVKPIAKKVKTDAPRSRAHAVPGLKGKAAFTLRLDQSRHLKLRLACAVNNKSAQMLVTDALDAFLDTMPEIGQLAANIPARK